jgi:hypothetical protein
MQALVFLYSSQTTCYFPFLVCLFSIRAMLVEKKWYLILVLTCISLMMNEVELVGHLNIVLREIFTQSLGHF